MSTNLDQEEEERVHTSIAAIRMEAKLFGKGQKTLQQRIKLQLAHRKMMLESMQGLEALREMKQLEKNLKLGVLKNALNTPL